MSTQYLGLKEVSAAATENPTATLGEVRYTNDATVGVREWKYVQFNNGTGNVASADGAVAYYVAASYGTSVVTCDVSDTSINQVAGILPSVFTDLYYGWMQTGGYHSAILTNADDDISASDTLIGGGDGTCNSVALNTASTNKVLGYALADDVNADDTVAGAITVGAF